MSMDNNTGVQTRAMAEAQHVEGVTNQGLTNYPEQAQGTPNPAMNPTVNLYRTKEEAIKEFIRQQATIALDWYVPNFCNTQVGDLITDFQSKLHRAGYYSVVLLSVNTSTHPLSSWISQQDECTHSSLPQRT